MSNASTPPGAPADRTPDGPIRRAFHAKLWTLLVEGRFGLNFLRRYWRRMLLVFVALLLPLWGFAELADEVTDGDPFAFDEPLLRWAHAASAPAADRFFSLVTHLGYEWLVIPLDIVLVLVLGWRGRMREGLFAALALGGSALLNMATKQLYARERPDLWTSLLPEETYSFPSGHAMGSMTLAAVVILLAWPTRWRWTALLLAGGFAVLVGASRVYLGVHFPSDILAGWTAAWAWAVASFLMVFHHHRHPWERPDAPIDNPEDV
ncbi:phosphatase PAP2 family protein [Lysobacter sp. A3-1-A15]|uniref:phosphatase PAP2 family protein n=1 Tax=Novilysobacter viscosus TaxID=3098602 RepID=UPI002ED9FB7E